MKTTMLSDHTLDALCYVSQVGAEKHQSDGWHEQDKRTKVQKLEDLLEGKYEDPFTNAFRATALYGSATLIQGKMGRLEGVSIHA